MKLLEYMNRETGELLSYKEAITEARELYDYGDPTNCTPLEEYYERLEKPTTAE